MPKGYYHESWRRLAAESDYVLDNPDAATDMVKAELLMFPIWRGPSLKQEKTIRKVYQNQLVKYQKRDRVLHLRYDEQVDKEMVADGWERTLRTYDHTFVQTKAGDFVRTEPVWIPILNRTRIASEAFQRCPPYVTRMYNATFPKKVHVSGHLWIEPVRIVSQRVTFDAFTYYNEPHISKEMAAMIYNKGGNYV